MEIKNSELGIVKFRCLSILHSEFSIQKSVSCPPILHSEFSILNSVSCPPIHHSEFSILNSVSCPPILHSNFTLLTRTGNQSSACCADQTNYCWSNRENTQNPGGLNAGLSIGVD